MSVCHSTRTAPSVVEGPAASAAACDSVLTPVRQPARREHGVADRDAPVDLVDGVVRRGADDLTGDGRTADERAPAVPRWCIRNASATCPAISSRHVVGTRLGNIGTPSWSAIAVEQTVHMGHVQRLEDDVLAAHRLGREPRRRVSARRYVGHGHRTPAPARACPGRQAQRDHAGPVRQGEVLRRRRRRPPTRALTDTSRSGQRRARRSPPAPRRWAGASRSDRPAATFSTTAVSAAASRPRR